LSGGQHGLPDCGLRDTSKSDPSRETDSSAGPEVPSPENETMKTYSFTLVIFDQQADTFSDFAEALFAAGCDDATPSISNGIVSIDFDRESESIDAALRSAVKQVESLGWMISKVEIDDLETLRDVA
jgi:hypothetical protein